MSKAVSALNGASYSGYVSIQEAGLRGMITLRGDLSDAKIKKAVKAATGVDIPKKCGCGFVQDRGAAWMSPDEVLVMVPYKEVTQTWADLAKALKGSHHLLADMSDARSVFEVNGARAREVIAKLAPVDLHPKSFGPGHFRRTRLAQVPAAFWMRGEESFEVMCFRSMSDYVYGLLCNAAMPGSEVGLF